MTIRKLVGSIFVVAIASACSTSVEHGGLSRFNGFEFYQQSEPSAAQRSMGWLALKRWKSCRPSQKSLLAEQLVLGRTLIKMPIGKASAYLGEPDSVSSDDVCAWTVTKDMQSKSELDVKLREQIIVDSYLYCEE